MDELTAARAPRRGPGARPLPRGTGARQHVVGSDHPGRSSTAGALLERSVEIDALRGAVCGLSRGSGAVVVLEAAPGLGKTALLETTVRLAARSDAVVRRAAPGPLERHFSFGVVRALLEAPLRDRGEQERTQLRDTAGAAVALLLDGEVPDGDAIAILSHSMMWLCAALAEERPLVFIVDDAQWADRSSLEMLCHLARRIEDLPLALVLGVRAEDPGAASDLLTLIGGVRAATLLHPQPLSRRGGVRLIRRFASEAPVAVCSDCHRAAGGNPWLLSELGRQLALHGPAAIDGASGEQPPVSAIARHVLRSRLAALSSSDRAIAAALAVLGPGTSPYLLATVAGVPIGDVAPARDALRAAGLLAERGDEFAHGLITQAVIAEVPRTERGRLHREAARALLSSGADLDVLASHLLKCTPEEDPEVSALLRRAAERAVGRAAPHTAVSCLERALEERAPQDDRGRMLARLATVAFDAGLPNAREHLRAALHELGDRDGRIEVLSRLAALNVVDGGDAGLAQLLEQELAGEPDAGTRLAVETAALDTLMAIPDRHAERARRLRAIAPVPSSEPLLRATILAHRAWLATELGTGEAGTCAQMAREALADDVLLEEARRRPGFHLCVRALIMSDSTAEAGAAITALREQALARGSLRMRVAAAWYDAHLALRSGHVAEGENHARLALDLGDPDVNVFTGGAFELLLYALAERGAFSEADALLRERGLDGEPGGMLWEIGVRHARARLWLSEGDFERAHAEALVAGALRERQGRPNPSWTPWRSTAALALAHLGRRAEAAALADAELALAEPFAAPLPIVGALHARVVAEEDAEHRIALCERALALARGSCALLQSVRVRLELGSTLAHAGRRVEARDALRRALADADEVGAVLLAQRARRELVATGLRPRRAALDGAAALTPRQRQICDLAAGGKSNRAIAQELFISIKTVETHLAAGYRKLGVNTRGELAGELTR